MKMEFSNEIKVTDINNVDHIIDKNDIAALYPGKVVLKDYRIIEILPDPKCVELFASTVGLEDKLHLD